MSSCARITRCGKVFVCCRSCRRFRLPCNQRVRRGSVSREMRRCSRANRAPVTRSNLRAFHSWSHKFPSHGACLGCRHDISQRADHVIKFPQEQGERVSDREPRQQGPNMLRCHSQWCEDCRAPCLGHSARSARCTCAQSARHHPTQRCNCRKVS